MDHNAIIFRHLAISQLLDGDYCKEFAAALAAGSFRGSFLFPVMELDPHDFYYSSN
jgi:hypothetical protein